MAGIMNVGSPNRAAGIMRRSRQKKSGGGGGKFHMRLSFGKTRVGTTSVGIWVAIHQQSWNSSVRDRGEVIEEEGMPWHNEVGHYAPGVGPRGMGFGCSSGPEQTKPCYGCAEYIRVRMDTDEQVAELIEQLGDNEKTQALVSTLYKGAKDIRKIGTSSKCVFSVLVLEEVIEVPKKGSKYTRNVLKPLASSHEIEASTGSHLFERATYSLSHTGRDQLMALQSQVRTTCASCGDGLAIIGWQCGSCDQVHEVDHAMFMNKDESFDHAAFDSYLQTAQKCDGCGVRSVHEEFFSVEDGEVPYSVIYMCDCEAPVEGSILNLALKIAERKITDTAKEIILLEATCLPPIPDAAMMEPLDLNPLKKGDSVESQKKRLGTLIDELDLDPTIVTLPKNDSEAAPAEGEESYT